MNSPQRRRIRTTALAAATVLVAGLVAAVPAVAAAPTVTSFSPKSGPLQTAVTVTGTHFAAPVKVTIGGVAAHAVTVASATKLVARVPLTAVSGRIRVSTAGGSATSIGSFTVTPGLLASPAVGPPTTVTTVHCSGFAAGEAVDVYVDTTRSLLGVTSAAGTLAVTVTIPATARPGTHWITAVGRRSGDAAQAAFTVRSNWAQQGAGPLHHGSNPYENTLGPDNAGSMGQAWSFTTGSRGVSFGSPSVANGLVYVGELNKVYALNAHTGARVWSYGVNLNSSPALVDGVVYLSSSDDTVYALNARTGALLWSFTTGSFVFGSPTVVNGMVYVGSYDDRVYALDATTGALVWSYLTGDYVLSTPAVANGLVYVGSGDGWVYALDAKTGEQAWSYETGGAIDSSPALANGLVYLGSSDDKVYALNATSGTKAWSYSTGSAVLGSPAVANGLLYVGSYDDKVYALRASTGALAWSFATGDPVYSSPAVANGVLYAGSDDQDLYALNARTGARLWSYATGGKIESSPAVANGLVYVGSDDDTIRAFGLDGAQAQGVPRPDPAGLHAPRA